VSVPFLAGNYEEDANGILIVGLVLVLHEKVGMVWNEVVVL
jgi:hypothetical protein